MMLRARAFTALAAVAALTACAKEGELVVDQDNSAAVLAMLNQALF